MSAGRPRGDDGFAEPSRPGDGAAFRKRDEAAARDGGTESARPGTAQRSGEAWLLDRDDPTARMEALGVLGKEPSLTVPASLDLSRYNIIDISVEPHDGNAAHSGQSMLRGTLR